MSTTASHAAPREAEHANRAQGSTQPQLPLPAMLASARQSTLSRLASLFSSKPSRKTSQARDESGTESLPDRHGASDSGAPSNTGEPKRKPWEHLGVHRLANAVRLRTRTYGMHRAYGMHELPSELAVSMRIDYVPQEARRSDGDAVATTAQPEPASVAQTNEEASSRQQTELQDQYLKLTARLANLMGVLHLPTEFTITAMGFNMASAAEKLEMLKAACAKLRQRCEQIESNWMPN